MVPHLEGPLRRHSVLLLERLHPLLAVVLVLCAQLKLAVAASEALVPLELGRPDDVSEQGHEHDVSAVQATSDLQVLDGNGAARRTLRFGRSAEVVQAGVRKDEPVLVPGAHEAFAHLAQPAGLDGSHEGSVLALEVVLLLHADLVGLDAVVAGLQKLLRQRLPIVDASVVVDELPHGHLLALREAPVVQVGVQHDDGEGQDEGCVGVGKHALRVLLVIGRRELLQNAVDLLRFAWQSEVREQDPEGLVQRLAGEVHPLEILAEHILVEGRQSAEELADAALAQPRRREHEDGHVLRIAVPQQSIPFAVAHEVRQRQLGVLVKGDGQALALLLDAPQLQLQRAVQVSVTHAQRARR
mmetsp:Transcript_4818/g.19318  ORF Transcript_4818/g.19318 Transcript_4818/m.19318 type:complete len:356 (+) Transcript_4818:648-1715(+)